MRNLSRATISQRAAIYLRWMKWVMQQRAGEGPTIMVPMDETYVTNVMDKRMAGAVVACDRQGELRNIAPAARCQLGCTALWHRCAANLNCSNTCHTSGCHARLFMHSHLPRCDVC